MRTIIVSASDEGYYRLLDGLLSSLHQWGAPPVDAIGILDVGLSEESAAALRGRVTHVVSPEWDLPIDSERQRTKPHLRAFSARPHLPKYFPGYDLYVWFDADTWVQEPNVVALFTQAAMGGDIGVCPQVHQSYIPNYGALAWRRNELYRRYGEEAVSLLDSRTYVNSGVFSLRADAPHWRYWQECSEAGFQSYPDTLSDQTCLNYALWTNDLPIHPLPSLYNWCCHLAVPSLNIQLGKWCEPHIPHQPVGVIHLTSNTKDLTFDVSHRGEVRQVNLRFNGASSLLGAR
jgi:lipopolysaccharide biosynthesis glycosyltransferase